jgi:hypothetical protein
MVRQPQPRGDAPTTDPPTAAEALPGPGRGPILAGAALLGLSLVAPLLAWAATPRGEVFGGFVEEARDGVSYVAKAAEGLAGHWLYHDPYTSEPHPGSLIYLPYVLLGQLDRVLHLPLPLLLHAASLALGGWLLWSLWSLAHACLADRGAARLGFVLAVFGGGVGALTGSHGDLFGYHYVSLDTGVSGTVGMQTLELAPHVLLACLGGVRLALLWVRRAGAPRPLDLLAGAAWVLATSAAYPQLAAMTAAAGALAWALRPSRGRGLTWLAWAVAALPYLAYGLYLKGHNPVFADWPPAHDIDVGDPLSYLLFGHLLMLPLAALAAWAALRRDRGGPLTFLASWLVVSAVLMYLPGLPAVLHRLYYGSFAPFGILAAAGLWRLRESVATPRARQRLVVYATALMCLTGVQAVVEPVGIVLGHRDDLALYFPAPDAAVLERLAAIRPEGGGLVMNTYLSGLFVPAYSRQTTYVGFPFETIDAGRKDAEARAFYALTDPAALRRRAARLGLDYVLWGRYERGLGGADPGALAGWPVLARDGDAILYQARGTGATGSAIRAAVAGAAAGRTL